MTSRLLAETLAKQIDLESIPAADLGTEADARPFISGTPRNEPSDFILLSRAVNNLTDQRLALATQRGILRSAAVNDPVVYVMGGETRERNFTMGEQAARVIPEIRNDITATLATINRLAARLTAAGHRFGNFSGLVRSAAIDGNNAEGTRDAWDDAA
jgi:hypothetical protein